MSEPSDATQPLPRDPGGGVPPPVPGSSVGPVPAGTAPAETAKQRRFATLTMRTVVITCVVALVSVLTTAGIAWPLANRAAYQEAQRSLATRADFVAGLMKVRAPKARKELARKLRANGFNLVMIEPKGPYPGNLLPDDVVTRIARDQKSVSTIVTDPDGKRMLVEGRSLKTKKIAWLGWGIVLYEPLSRNTGAKVLARLAVALPVGLLAGIIAGILLARRVARPLRRAAQAAQQMSGGHRDVTLPEESPAEAAELSRALNNLNQALAASEDRQRAFLMSVSHELRTPMTTIQGYAEALADGVLPPDAGRDAGRVMLAEAGRLDRLIADLLSLARLQAQQFPVEMVVVDLVAVVDGAATAWAPRCQEVGVQLRSELPSGPVWAYTDPGRIRQVLDGLVENALRLVPAGAPIILATRAENHLAVAEVRDGGPGLTDQDLAVAFEQGALNQRYRGVRRVGSGLGLALAAQLITRLGGRIEAGHAPEGGARFTFRLPLRFH
ncbi:MAG: HAMP domain-containing sensor histidine kinase [Micromonosporaceae bacterium]